MMGPLYLVKLALLFVPPSPLNQFLPHFDYLLVAFVVPVQTSVVSAFVAVSVVVRASAVPAFVALASVALSVQASPLVAQHSVVLVVVQA